MFFGRELDLCSRKEPLPRSHTLLKLAPFVDADGILRVDERLKNALLDPDVKHPAIMPRDSSFSRLVIADFHERTLHGSSCPRSVTPTVLDCRRSFSSQLVYSAIHQMYLISRYHGQADDGLSAALARHTHSPFSPFRR